MSTIEFMRVCWAVCVLLLLLTTIEIYFQGLSKWASHFVRSSSSSRLTRDQPCTLQLLGQLTADSGHFVNKTSWKKTSSGTKTLTSDACKMPNDSYTNISKCLSDKNIKKIVIFGDSNSALLRKGLYALLLAQNFKCKTNYRNYEKDVHGYSVLSRDPDCSGCSHHLNTCVKNNQVILIDRVPLMSFMSTVLAATNVNIDYIKKMISYAKLPLPQYFTYPQDIFKDFYQRGDYPDLILLAMNSHDTKRYSLKEIELFSKYLTNMIDIYLPTSTTVVIFDKQYEEIRLKPKIWRIKTYENRTLLHQIRLMNDAIARGMKAHFANASRNVFPFFDIYEMGRQGEKEWGRDGVHKQPAWYTLLIKSFFSVYCNKLIATSDQNSN